MSLGKEVSLLLLASTEDKLVSWTNEWGIRYKLLYLRGAIDRLMVHGTWSFFQHFEI